MILNNHKKCDKCGDAYNASPFYNMSANGELLYSSIIIYGNKYDFCPRCTKEIYELIRKETKNE